MLLRRKAALRQVKPQFESSQCHCNVCDGLQPLPGWPHWWGLSINLIYAISCLIRRTRHEQLVAQSGKLNRMAKSAVELSGRR